MTAVQSIFIDPNDEETFINHPQYFLYLRETEDGQEMLCRTLHESRAKALAWGNHISQMDKATEQYFIDLRKKVFENYQAKQNVIELIARYKRAAIQFNPPLGILPPLPQDDIGPGL